MLSLRKERAEVYHPSFLTLRRVVIKRIMISIFVLRQVVLNRPVKNLRLKDEHSKCTSGK